MLRNNGFALDAACWPRAAVISAVSVFNSLAAAVERRYPTAAARPTAPPLFILGHWRSGTTHLHNLLACDRRFIAPTLYQVLFPHTFRSTEKLLAGVLSALFAGPRGFDNVRFAFDLPNEDEFALSLMTSCSPYMGRPFPRRRKHYEKFLAFSNCSPDEIGRWRVAMKAFVDKFAGGSGRTPLLKSPPHTARIRLLLDLFPGAKFLHVHRHPYAVYQSRREQLVQMHMRHHLQRRDLADIDDEIVSVYRQMHEGLFRQRELVPAGDYHEIEYDELARDPLGELQAAYHALSFGEFDAVEATMRCYLDTIGDYARNSYAELPAGTRERLAGDWRESFDEWRYAR
jgi:hypothetical protein